MLSLACFTATVVSLLRTDTNSARSLFVTDRAVTDCSGGGGESDQGEGCIIIGRGDKTS